MNIVLNKVSINNRQREILKIIIEKYIHENIAVSSLNLQQDNLFSLSSATIRNEMVFLENKGFLKKEHKSSGRIPTKEGYKIYIETMLENLNSIDPHIKKKLIDLFSKRNESIDIALDESVKLISGFLNLPIIVTKIKNLDDELLKKIDITEIDENNYLIFIITSLGEIYKNVIFINHFKEREDLSICLRMLNEKLINCPISLVEDKIKEILPEIRKNVHKYEFVYEGIISIICQGIINKQKPIYKIYNSHSIVFQPEVKNHQINLKEIFQLLENFSTFSQLNFNYLKTGKTLINLENNVEGLSIASTTLNFKNHLQKLSVVGPLRMNYALIKCLFDFINEKLINKK